MKYVVCACIVSIALASWHLAHVHYGSHAQGVAVASFSLRPGDVPRGFVMTSSGSLSNAQLSRMSRLPPHVLLDIGRVGGYETTFRRHASRGISVIYDETHQFRPATGAEIFDSLNVRLIQGLWHQQHFRLVSGIQVGDHSWVYSTQTEVQGYSFTTYTIYFRQGVFGVHIDVEGSTRSVTVALLMRLAHTVDMRIRAEVGPWGPAPVSPATGRVPFLPLHSNDLPRGYRIVNRLILTNGI